jgi:hypothetical protein
MNYYLAQNAAGEYLCGIDENEDPIYSSDFSQSLWSWSQTRLQNYIDDNSISDATVQSQDSGGNNPPQKPPF